MTDPQQAGVPWPSIAWERSLLENANHPALPAVVENFIVCWLMAGPGTSDSTLPLEIAVSPRSIVTVTAKVALKAGSSKHGNARRASVDSNCVESIVPTEPFSNSTTG